VTEQHHVVKVAAPKEGAIEELTRAKDPVVPDQATSPPEASKA
jgi:hypothetical protein